MSVTRYTPVATAIATAPSENPGCGSRVGDYTGTTCLSWLGAILCLHVISCSQPDAQNAVSRATIVHSEQPAYGQGTLVELTSIGAADGPDEYIFSQITMFAVGPAGETYIADLEGEVRRFDAEGVFERVVARVGRGPGEVLYVVGMAVSPSGDLAVIDMGNARVSVWSSTGELLRDWLFPTTRPAYGRDALLYDDDGDLWIRLIRAASESITAMDDVTPIFARLENSGNVRDTVFLPPTASKECVARDLRRAVGFWEDKMEPFLPMLKWTRGKDGTLVVGCPARYELDVFRADGRATNVSRSWTPSRTSSGEKAFYAATRLREEIPDTKPAFHRLWVADDGRIWAWRAGPGVKRYLRDFSMDVWNYYSAQDGFDVFDVDGHWLGHVETPIAWGVEPFPGIGDPFIRGDTVWAVTVDDWGANYVTKFVVKWPL